MKAAYSGIANYRPWKTALIEYDTQRMREHARLLREVQNMYGNSSAKRATGSTAPRAKSDNMLPAEPMPLRYSDPVVK